MEISIADRNRDGTLNQFDVDVTRLAADDSVLGTVLGTQVVFIGESLVEVRAGAFGATVAKVRINVATATENDLTDENGEALITVRSTSDSGISVHANERNLVDIDAAATGDEGADIGDVDAATSKDSGTFVGIFGIIEAEWKDMLAQWLEDDGDAGDITPVLRDVGLSRGVIHVDDSPLGTNVISLPVEGSTTTPQSHV